MSQLVESALTEFQRYLANEIPPTAIPDALAILMAKPPDVLMERVATWITEEATKRRTPIGELLLFAMTKIYVTGELNLLDREAIANYLDRITGVCVRICPEAERDQLRASITEMRRSRTRDAAIFVSNVKPIAVSQPMVSAGDDCQDLLQLVIATNAFHEQADHFPMIRLALEPFRVDEWLALPSIELVHPSSTYWPLLQDVGQKAQVRGALMMDAYLAVLAIENGATLCTTDRDFARFEGIQGLRVLNPLAAS